MDNQEIQKMLAWLDVPVPTTEMNSNDLEQVIQDAQRNDTVEMDEYTTAKHVVVDAIKTYEQMALIINVYYHATIGAKILNVVDLDSKPDTLQMHIRSDKYNE